MASNPQSKAGILGRDNSPPRFFAYQSTDKEAISLKVQLLALITHQVRLAIEDRYIKSYHPFSAPHAEVYVDRIQKNSRYPWLLDVEGTAQMEDGGYEWEAQFDISTEEWTPIRYFFGGHIYFMDVEE